MKAIALVDFIVAVLFLVSVVSCTDTPKPATQVSGETTAGSSSGAVAGEFSLNRLGPEELGEVLTSASPLNESSVVPGEEVKAHVFVMMGVNCPIARLYLPRLLEYQEKYKEKGVQFYFVYSNLNEKQEEVEKIAQGSRTEGTPLPLPVIFDEDQTVADALNAKVLSQTFVLNDKFEVKYQGMIDDQYTISQDMTARRLDKPKTHYLVEALDAMLDGKIVQSPATLTQGCVLQRKKEVTSHELTYNRDIAPIMRERCEKCHSEGAVMEWFPLNTYEEVEASLDTIAHRVANRIMPPWSADKNYGKFKNDISLTNEEIDKMIRWIQAGAPEGDGNPPPPREKPKTDGVWKLGTPDDIYVMEKAYDVPAQEPEDGLDYVYLQENKRLLDLTIDPTKDHKTDEELGEEVLKARYTTKIFEEEKYLLWSQVVPGAPGVVHHVIVYILRPADDKEVREDVSAMAQAMEGGGLQKFLIKRLYRVAGDNSKFMNEFYGVNGNRRSWEIGRYVPGADMTVYNEEFGVRVPKGSKLVFEMHYTPNGTATTDRTMIGVKWTDRAPKYQVHTLPLGHLHKIRIPAYDETDPEVAKEASNYVLTRNHTFEKDVVVLWVRPHGHLRAEAFRYEVDWPDGKTEILLSVPKYDFNNQPYYEFEEPLRLPKGSTLRLIGRYNNSPSNPNLNEDMWTRRVLFGLQTHQSMFFGYVTLAVETSPEETATNDNTEESTNEGSDG